MCNSAYMCILCETRYKVRQLIVFVCEFGCVCVCMCWCVAVVVVTCMYIVSRLLICSVHTMYNDL